MNALRVLLRFGASVLSVSGVLLLLDVALTVAWQEPVSMLIAMRHQGAADDDVQREFASFASELPAATMSDGRAGRQALRTAAARYARRLREGRGIGRVSLSSLGRSFALMQGTDTDTLRKGPAHYSDTPLPGQGGTIGIAGHRTTYLAPFRSLNKLRRDDPIVVTMPYGRFTYRVRRTRIVSPEEVSVKRPVGYEQVILSACHPLYSAAQRIVVFARLTRIQPRSASSGA